MKKSIDWQTNRSKANELLMENMEAETFRQRME